MKIDYDKLYDKWVVWKVGKNFLEELYCSRSKRKCLKYKKEVKDEKRYKNR